MGSDRMFFSGKDKKILIFFGVFIALVLMWEFFLAPQMKLISNLKSRLNSGQNTYKANIAYGEKLKGMDNGLEKINQKLKDLRTKYPPAMNYDEVYIILRNMARTSGLDIISLNFGSISEINASGSKGAESTNGESSNGDTLYDGAGSMKAGGTDYNKKIADFLISSGLGGIGSENSTAGGSSAVADGKAYQLSVKISASGTMEEIRGFLQGIESLKSKPRYKEFQINLSNKDVLNLDTTIAFIGIADKNADKYTMLETGEWSPLNPAGKADIFDPYEEYSGTYAPKASNDTVGSFR